jgi:rieske iron-sulfur protein
METARKISRSARRRLLKLIVALGIAPAGSVLADEAEDAALAPRTDDWLVFAFGENAGNVITPDDLGLASRQVFAYAMDPVSGTIRSGSRLNQVVLIRLDPEMLAADTLARSAGGVVGYSGVCSHTGCDVTDWNAEVARFQCPCHESQFDPADGARVVGGPAPWQLAALPLKLIDGKLAVAGEFVGQVGFMQPGQNPFGL